jgi:hypothetical protein
VESHPVDRGRDWRSGVRLHGAAAGAEVKAATSDILAQLLEADVLRYAVSLIEHDATKAQGAHISGRFQMAILKYLPNHPEFKFGPALLHAEVGTPRIEFRSLKGAFGDGSLQIVINLKDGRFYADVDNFNPYESWGEFMKHNVLEVYLPKWFKKG